MTDVFIKHQRKIAVATMKLSPAGALILGGMDHATARVILQNAGWTTERINSLAE